MLKWIIYSIVVILIICGTIWIIDIFQQEPISNKPMYLNLYGIRFTCGLGGPMFLEYPPTDPCIPCFSQVVCIQSSFLEEFFHGSIKELDITNYITWHLGDFVELNDSTEDNVLIQELLNIMKNPMPIDENTIIRGIDYNIIFIRGGTGIAIPIKINFSEKIVYCINGQYPLLYLWLEQNIFSED